MNDLISICIPSYNRPAMLAEALESCALQDYAALEIVIGDDSTNADSEAVADNYRSKREWKISYRRNAPGLGQNDNVNELFDRATGDRLILLHDDDKLLPGAVTALARAWDGRPGVAVAIGRQAIIDADGSRDDAATIALNEEFFRTGPSRFLPPVPAALLQQFPNDGYMILRDLATRTRYRSREEISSQCDVEFSLRACAHLGDDAVYYVDALVAEYRRHEASISFSAGHRLPNPVVGRLFFATIDSLDVAPEYEYARRSMNRRFVDRVLKGFALNSRRGEAFRLFLSDRYGWRRRLSAKGAYHLALIALPSLDRFRKYRA